MAPQALIVNRINGMAQAREQLAQFCGQVLVELELHTGTFAPGVGRSS